MDNLTNKENSKPLNRAPVPMDLDEYLGRYGVSSPVCDYTLDKMRCNRQLRTERGKRRFKKECDEASAAYHLKRDEKIDEYNKMVASGLIRPRTNVERTILKAQGNPDRSDVQAARRMCFKRGIDWRTGESLPKEA